MRRAAAAVAVSLVLALTGCSVVGGTDDTGLVTGDFNVAEVTAVDRGAPVESSGETIDGGTLDIADYRGKVLVVNVWYSACGPCRKELPLLVSATASYGDDVALVGINTRDLSKDDARVYERGLGVDFPSIYDPGGRTLLDFDGKLNYRQVPSTAVLDREGRLAALISGALPTEQTLRSVLDRVVDDEVTGGPADESTS